MGVPIGTVVSALSRARDSSRRRVGCLLQNQRGTVPEHRRIHIPQLPDRQLARRPSMFCNHEAVATQLKPTSSRCILRPVS